MPRELRPGAFSEVFGVLAGRVMEVTPVVLESAASRVETAAKQNASNGEHPYRTKIPARPGRPRTNLRDASALHQPLQA